MSSIPWIENVPIDLVRVDQCPRCGCLVVAYVNESGFSARAAHEATCGKLDPPADRDTPALRGRVNENVGNPFGPVPARLEQLKAGFITAREAYGHIDPCQSWFGGNRCQVGHGHPGLHRWTSHESGTGSTWETSAQDEGYVSSPEIDGDPEVVDSIVGVVRPDLSSVKSPSLSPGRWRHGHGRDCRCVCPYHPTLVMHYSDEAMDHACQRTDCRFTNGILAALEDGDQGDSQALIELRCAIDSYLGWDSSHEEEAGDYLARIKQVGKLLGLRQAAPPPAEAWGEREAKQLQVAGDTEPHPWRSADWLAVARKAGEIAAEKTPYWNRLFHETLRERDAARADLARVTRERDEARKGLQGRTEENLRTALAASHAECERLRASLNDVTSALSEANVDQSQLIAISKEARADLAAAKAECERLSRQLATLEGLPASDKKELADFKAFLGLPKLDETLAAARAEGFEAGRDAAEAIRIFAAAKAHQESDCRRCKGGQAMVCMRAVALAEEWDKRWKRLAKDSDPSTVEVSPTGKLTLRPPTQPPEPGAGEGL